MIPRKTGHPPESTNQQSVFFCVVYVRGSCRLLWNPETPRFPEAAPCCAPFAQFGSCLPAKREAVTKPKESPGIASASALRKENPLFERPLLRFSRLKQKPRFKRKPRFQCDQVMLRWHESLPGPEEAQGHVSALLPGHAQLVIARSAQHPAGKTWACKDCVECLPQGR